VDYQGRSWVEPPSGVRPGDNDHECFIPKKCIKKYTGHTKGVHAIEFFPNTGGFSLGHVACNIDILISCSCVFKAYRPYICLICVLILVTYSSPGHLLLSASMDGKCKIWDVFGDRNVRRTYAGHEEAIR
jgi:pre-mRNA-processing factor 17